jgi:hypothetical protein
LSGEKYSRNPRPERKTILGTLEQQQEASVAHTMVEKEPRRQVWKNRETSSYSTLKTQVGMWSGL